MSIFNLGQIAGIVIADAQPTNRNLIWLDQAEPVSTNRFKIFDENPEVQAWVSINQPPPTQAGGRSVLTIDYSSKLFVNFSSVEQDAWSVTSPSLSQVGGIFSLPFGQFSIEEVYVTAYTPPPGGGYQIQLVNAASGTVYFSKIVVSSQTNSFNVDPIPATGNQQPGLGVIPLRLEALIDGENAELRIASLTCVLQQK